MAHTRAQSGGGVRCTLRTKWTTTMGRKCKTPATESVPPDCPLRSIVRSIKRGETTTTTAYRAQHSGLRHFALCLLFAANNLAVFTATTTSYALETETLTSNMSEEVNMSSHSSSPIYHHHHSTPMLTINLNVINHTEENTTATPTTSSITTTTTTTTTITDTNTSSVVVGTPERLSSILRKKDTLFLTNYYHTNLSDRVSMEDIIEAAESRLKTITNTALDEHRTTPARHYNNQSRPKLTVATTTAAAAGGGRGVYFSPANIKLIWSLVFGTMIAVGILANLLVVATIGGHKSLHTPTNCFLLNLTLSDLVTLLFNANFNFFFMLNEHWPFGATYCVANNFIANMTLAVSVFTIMFTSKERYNAIVHPLRKRMTKKRAIIHIILIWLAGVLFAMPALIFSKTVNRFPLDVPLKPGQVQRTICLLKWPDGFPGKSKFDFIYNLAFLVLTYLLPLMTMAIAYTLMARVLWGSKQIGESTQAQMNLICSKQKVVRMLICVVVVFGVCWLPYHVYFLVTYQWPQVTNVSSIKHIYLAIYWLAMSNSLLNPIILLLMNKRFRRYSVKLLNFWPLNQILCCCILKAQQLLPSETLHTAIVQAHGPNHGETTTVLVCGSDKKPPTPELGHNNNSNGNGNSVESALVNGGGHADKDNMIITTKSVLNGLGELS